MQSIEDVNSAFVRPDEVHMAILCRNNYRFLDITFISIWTWPIKTLNRCEDTYIIGNFQRNMR